MPGPLRPHLDLPQKSKTALTDGFKIFGLPPEALAKGGPLPEALAKCGLPPEALAKGGASKVLRQLKLPRLATLRVLAPLHEIFKNHPFGWFKISGASKGARTLDLNLGKVAL